MFPSIQKNKSKKNEKDWLWLQIFCSAKNVLTIFWHHRSSSMVYRVMPPSCFLLVPFATTSSYCQVLEPKSLYNAWDTDATLLPYVWLAICLPSGRKCLSTDPLSNDVETRPRETLRSLCRLYDGTFRKSFARNMDETAAHATAGMWHCIIHIVHDTTFNSPQGWGLELWILTTAKTWTWNINS